MTKVYFLIQIMTHTLVQSESAYRIPNVRFTGHLCRTNIQSGTAFRGFGAPQAAVIGEMWLAHVAATLGVEPTRVTAKKTFFLKKHDKSFLIRPNHLA